MATLKIGFECKNRRHYRLNIAVLTPDALRCTQYRDVKTVYGFRVTGLKNHYRTPGLGVPLVVRRAPIPKEERTAEDYFLMTHMEQSFPATGLIRIRGVLPY